MLLAEDVKAVERALGADDFNILREALKVNITCDKTAAIMRKILWSHARGLI